MFKSARRMFTVRAETTTKLAVIDLDTLIDVFSAHPQSHHMIFKKALDRYIFFRQSMIRAEPYQMITMNSPFWDAEDGIEETVLHARIQEWLEVVVKHKDEQKNRYRNSNQQSGLAEIFHPISFDQQKCRSKNSKI